MGRQSKTDGIPDVQLLKQELKRTRHNNAYRSVLQSTVFALVVVAAISILITTLWIPVLRTYGHSMTPTLSDGDIVLAVKNTDMRRGDLVAFYVNNKLLIKRVIARSGETVVIDADGYVYVNGEKLSESYVSEYSPGNCDIEFPYTVPDSALFVLGDRRATSVDSRRKAVGCVYEEQIVGKVVFRVWPFDSFGDLSIR